MYIKLKIIMNLRCAGTYSGGNKRKLSTAIALVGKESRKKIVSPTILWELHFSKALQTQMLIMFSIIIFF